MSRYAAVIKKWQTEDLSSEEYQEAVKGVAEMSNREIAAIFRTSKHDLLRQEIREEIIVRSLLGAAWQKALTWIAIVLGAASSVATIRDAFRERPASPVPPAIDTGPALHISESLPVLDKSFSEPVVLRLQLLHASNQ